MNARRYRQFITASVALLAVLFAVVWVLNPEGDDARLPQTLESVFPLPGDTVVRQTAIEVDLPVGYSLELDVDGAAIPQTEIGYTPATGRYIWQPGPFKMIEIWESGEHTITIRWERFAGGGPDPGEFAWTIRIT